MGRRNLASTNAFASFAPTRKSLSAMHFQFLEVSQRFGQRPHLLQWDAFCLQLLSLRHFLQKYFFLELNHGVCVRTVCKSCGMHVCSKGSRCHWRYRCQRILQIIIIFLLLGELHINSLVLRCVTSPRRPAHFSTAPSTLRVSVLVSCEVVQRNWFN